MKYEYDESGVFFYYFILSVLICLTLPVTAVQFFKKRTTEFKFPWSHLPSYQQHDAQRKTPKQSINKWLIAAAIGWCLIAITGFKINSIEVKEQALAWDPYVILGVSYTSSAADIKKAYRKLSLIWHPDKAENATMANEMFVDISKAYKTLTDDATRENWEKYGNPDGKQTMSFGIALPESLVSDNKYLFLLMYGLLFGILLPYITHKWWSNQARLTSTSISSATISIFVQEFKEQNISIKRILEVVSASVEMMNEVEVREGEIEKIKSLFSEVAKEVLRKTGERLEFPKKFNAAYVLKSFTLIHAHLNRVPISDSKLLQDAHIIIPLAHRIIIKGVLPVISANYWLYPSMHVIEACRLLVHALSPAVSISGPSFFAKDGAPVSEGSLFMLPYMSDTAIKALKTKKGKTGKIVRCVNDLMDIEKDERQRCLSEAYAEGLAKADPLIDIELKHEIAQKQAAEAIEVARSIPRLSILDVEFRCIGEEKVTPGSLVTFIAKLGAVDYRGEETRTEKNSKALGILSLSTASSTKSKTKNEDGTIEDDYEVDSDGEIYASKAERAKVRPSKLTKLLNGSYFSNPNTPIYAPYYPQHDATPDAYKRPTYYLWLCNPQNNRVVGNPLQIQKLVPISLYADESSSDGVIVVNFKFQAPNSSGVFGFSVCVMCDGYVGVDAKRDIRLTVVPVGKEEEIERAKYEKEIWREFEEEDRIEKQVRANVLGGGFAPIKNTEIEEDSDSDWSSSGSEYGGEDE